VGVRGTGRDLNQVCLERRVGACKQHFLVKFGSSVSFPGWPVVGRRKLR
jgi:hypothetical protein